MGGIFHVVDLMTLSCDEISARPAMRANRERLRGMDIVRNPLDFTASSA